MLTRPQKTTHSLGPSDASDFHVPCMISHQASYCFNTTNARSRTHGTYNLYEAEYIEYIAQPQGSYEVAVVEVMVAMVQAAPSAIVIHPATNNVPAEVH